MWDCNRVTRLEYRSGYSYFVGFDDGLSAVLDFAEYPNYGGVFAPLRSLEFFRQAHIEGGSIAWPNGADIAPETLYMKCEQAALSPAS